MKIPIVFEPQFSIGDQVYLKINPEKKMVIDAYKIYLVNTSGEVVAFNYSMYDGEGNQYFFTDIDIELQETNSK